MTTIHRLLDDAFAGVTMDDDVQDLKEEIRGNLAARVKELEGKGTDAATAANTAFAELGDIRELIAEVADGRRPPTSTDVSAAEAMARNRVKPRPGYVVRTVLVSLVLAASAAIVTLQKLHVLGLPALGLVAAAVFGIAIAFLTTDALRQETSQHYPSPTRRAIAWGIAAGVAALGLALFALFFADGVIWQLMTGITLALAGISGLTWLGVTQTNRTKPWALTMQRQYEANDPFAGDPGAAARFGMYTVVIWTLAIAGFIVLSITVGLVWSWLAIVGGLVVFFLVLAQMVFPAKKPS